MPTLTVRFVGPVRRPGPERELQLAPPATTGDLLTGLHYTPAEQRTLQVLADGRRARLEDGLAGVQLVEILIPIGGG